MIKEQVLAQQRADFAVAKFIEDLNSAKPL